MKLLRRALVLAATLAALAVARAAWAAPPTVTVLADGFPPLQYEGADGQPAGYVHAFVQELLARAGVAARPLQFVPLKRALATAQVEPNVLLLSIARTPEREEALIWLREVAPYKLWLYRARNSAVPAPRSLAELKGRGLRFGVQDGSNFEAWLRRQGIGAGGDNSVVDAVHQNVRNLRKAQLQRIDLFAHPDLSLAYRAREQGLAPEDFEAVLTIPELSSPLWLALSRGSDPALQQALLRAADALIAAGRLEMLRRQQAAPLPAPVR
jgi:polar amino acid transport system substrate-binding protein